MDEIRAKRAKPAYVCTKCCWCGSDLSEHASCGYSVIDTNAEARMLVAEIDRLTALLAAHEQVERDARAFRARVVEIEDSPTMKGLYSWAVAHGFSWPGGLNWAAEEAALRSSLAELQSINNAAKEKSK